MRGRSSAGSSTHVHTGGTLDVGGVAKPSVSANSVGFGGSALVVANGAISIAQSGGTAEGGIEAGHVTADKVSVHADSNPGKLHAASGGLSASAFAGAAVMISEGFAGGSAHAEATGEITTNQLDVVAKATRGSDPGVSFLHISTFRARSHSKARGRVGRRRR